MTKKLREAWFSTTEIEDLVGAIEHCAELALVARYDAAGWKWLILALHNAMQGVCVCALHGSDPSHATIPRQALLSLTELYGRVTDVHYLGAQHKLPVTRDMTLDIAKLAELRNDFDNFRPGGYALEVSRLPGIVRTCCHAIQHLAIDQSTFRRRIGGNQKRRIELALKALCKAMDKCETRR